MLRTAAKKVFGLLPARMRQTVRASRDARRNAQLRRCLAQVGAADVAVPDVNHLLHHLRGRALAQLPREVAHFVSVGCAGTWYFEWIDRMCKPLRHTGIEFYSPRPDDLPAHVDWIANTAGNMEALADGTADLLFSGQNIEHLWPQDIANFLLESHRVLRDGGLLVIDSPNRRLTALLQWSHPEHTIELTLPEIRELLALAGFDVQREQGLWLCEDPGTGTVLAFDEMTAQGPWPLARRVGEAAAHPQSSFIWWVEARKAARPPQAQQLRERIRQIHAVAWPERLNRLKSIIGTSVDRQGQAWFDSGGREGALLYGPYTALPAGRHSVTFTLECPQRPAGAAAVVQVTAANGATLLARREVGGDVAEPGTPFSVELAFDLPDTTFNVEFVVLAFPRSRLRAQKAVRLVTEETADTVAA